MPARGKIGIFNRSYYEEVLVVRVHPEMLDAQHLPDACRSEEIWQERFEDISAFERYCHTQRNRDSKVLPELEQRRAETPLPRPA